MAQFQDERRIITENLSDPTHGEREKSQEQEQQQQVADDLNDQPGGDEHEVAGDQPQKKSMLQKVKDTAKTLIHKHVYLFGNDDGETEDHHQFEDAEENHENFTREEDKEDTDGMKKEKEHDFNSNLNSKPADGSAVSPGLDALSTRNLSNDSDVANDLELANLGIQSVSPDANVVAADYEPGSTSDRAAMLAETAGLQQEAAMLAETTRLQQGVATVPGQLPAGIPPILQSTEAATTAYPYDDGQTDKFLDKYMVHQVNDISTTDIRTSATHPVQSEFSQALPNLAPYSRQEEAPENQLYWDDESEKIEYSDPFAKGPRAPKGMMEHITEEPTVETIHIQEATEDRWFDANDVVAGAPSLEDQSCSLSHPSLEQFAVTESIPGEVEYGDQDRVWGTEIDAHADISDELQDLRAKEAERRTVSSDEDIVGDPIVKDQDPSVTHVGSDEFGSTEVEGEHHSVDEVPYKPDKMAEEGNFENSMKDKSYGDEIYETDCREKNENSSNLGNGYGEYEVAAQEETEKRTEWPSADDEEWAHEESGRNLTYAPSADEIVYSSNEGVEEEAEWQNDDGDGGKTVEDEGIQEAERNE